MFKRNFFSKVKRLRNDFPFLEKKPLTIFLDNAGTTLKPVTVIESIKKCYVDYSLNPHSVSSYPGFRKVDQIINETRELLIEKIEGNSPEELVFIPSATHSFNFLALACKTWLKKGDEIALTYLEHSSNYYPWEILTKEIGVKLIFLPLNFDNQIDLFELDKYINNHTKVVSFFQVSNALGVINPVTKIVEVIKKRNPDCLVIVDACQSITANQEIFAKQWKIDVLVFSAHKMYGPTGLGILWVNSASQKKIPSVLWGGGKIKSPLEKVKEDWEDSVYYQEWEVGTPPLAQIFGLNASLKWMKKQKRNEIIDYLSSLVEYMVLKMLVKVLGIIIYNKRIEREVGIVTFNLTNYHSQDVVDYLGRNNLIVRGGNFCCPFLYKIIKTNSAIRISLALYNTFWEVDRLIFLLAKIKNYSLLI